MASTYSSLLRIELQTPGENDGSWGAVLNTDWQLVENAIAGRAAVTHSNAADYTLTTANGAADEARRMIVSVGGALTANRNVVCPTLSKLYAYRNLTTGGFATTLKTAAGTGILVPNGKYTLLLSDGTNVLDAINYLSALSLGTPLAVADGGTGANNAADARTNLGLTGGGGDTTYNFRANNLSDVANVVTARSNLGVSATGADTIYAFRANNLSDLPSAATARSNLGLGTMATQAASAVAITGGTVAGITDLAVADGGTGASTAQDARTNLGAAALASPVFTGTPSAPTAPPDNDTTLIASTAFVLGQSASDAEVEAGALATRFISPARAHRSRSASKAQVNFVGATVTIGDSFNVASVTRSNVGTYRVNFTTSFSSGAFVPVGMVTDDATDRCEVRRDISSGISSSFADIRVRNQSGTLTDPAEVYIAFYGDQ